MKVAPALTRRSEPDRPPSIARVAQGSTGDTPLIEAEALAAGAMAE